MARFLVQTIPNKLPELLINVLNLENGTLRDTREKNPEIGSKNLTPSKSDSHLFILVNQTAILIFFGEKN